MNILLLSYCIRHQGPKPSLSFLPHKKTIYSDSWNCVRIKPLTTSQCGFWLGKNLTGGTLFRPETKLGIFTSSDLNRRTACSKDCLDFLLLTKEAGVGRTKYGAEGGMEIRREEPCGMFCGWQEPRTLWALTGMRESRVLCTEAHHLWAPIGQVLMVVGCHQSHWLCLID